jgi:hypothetical protein
MKTFFSQTFLSTMCFTMVGIYGSQAWSDEHEPEPILSVADYDGNGRVSRHDLLLIRQAIDKGQYVAFYDKDANGVLDNQDYRESRLDLGRRSTQLDREMAVLFVKFGWLQNKTATDAEDLYGFLPMVASLSGHGEHWMNDAGVQSVGVSGTPTFDMVQGLNIPKDGSEIRGLFWGEGATPLFNDPADASGLSSLDWPTGDAWKQERVQAFAGHAPSFTSSDAEMWHTHAGLCLVYDEKGQGYVHQHTSFYECQQYPNSAPIPIGADPDTGAPILGNIWANLWMIHLWFYDLNPNGLFAGTHPDVDPDSPSEMETYDGREVPEFFQNHHH